MASFTTVTAAGILPSSPAEKAPAPAAPLHASAAAAAPAAAPGDADKIKAEHMRSSSALPGLSPFKLGTKSSLLPSAAADAARLAAAAAGAQPQPQTTAAPGTHGQGSAATPGTAAANKPGRQSMRLCRMIVFSIHKAAIAM